MLNRWRVRAGRTERSGDRAGSTTRGTPGWTEGPDRVDRGAYSGRHGGKLRASHHGRAQECSPALASRSQQ